MNHPKLFVDPCLPNIILQLLTENQIKQHCCIYYGTTDCSIIQQIQLDSEIALVLLSANDIDNESLRALSSNKELNTKEILVFSEGQPNSFLDNWVSRRGYFHFRAPYNLDIVKETLKDYFQTLTERIQRKRSVTLSNLDQFGLLVGSSHVMHQLYRLIRKVAESSTNVFIIGESGTGKELVATTIHNASDRSDKPFIALNCGALSPELIESELFGHKKGAFTGAISDKQGVFQQAQNGTLFLDEITEMPIEHQVKLLRVLEMGEYRAVGSEHVNEVNVRVIAASNREPGQAIEQNYLREDLYYRLAQFPINVPPLREREGDITGLAQHFLALYNVENKTQKQLTQKALAQLTSHDWPGNVRELLYVIERACILSNADIDGEHITIEVLEDTSVSSTNTNSSVASIKPGTPLSDVEKIAIETTLDANSGNRGETAEQLGISVKTLYNKLEKYQVEDTPEN